MARGGTLGLELVTNIIGSPVVIRIFILIIKSLKVLKTEGLASVAGVEGHRGGDKLHRHLMPYCSLEGAESWGQ